MKKANILHTINELPVKTVVLTGKLLGSAVIELLRKESLFYWNRWSYDHIIYCSDSDYSQIQKNLNDYDFALFLRKELTALEGLPNNSVVFHRHGLNKTFADSGMVKINFESPFYANC
jgi:hypothetical protein